jgi:hypothetical protein
MDNNINNADDNSVSVLGPQPEPPITVTVVDDAPTPSEPQPAAIAMQPDTQEDLDRAAAAREKIEAASAPAVEPVAPRIPVLDKTSAEIEAGRRRVVEHESRAILQNAKSSSDVSESQRVTTATEQNKDL